MMLSLNYKINDKYLKLGILVRSALSGALPSEIALTDGPTITLGLPAP